VEKPLVILYTHERKFTMFVTPDLVQSQRDSVLISFKPSDSPGYWLPIFTFSDLKIVFE